MDRPYEPNPPDIDVQVGDELSNDLPRIIQIEPPTPLTDTRNFALTGTGTLATSFATIQYDDEIDGWLVYVADDVAANKADIILVANARNTGGANDDVLTPGHGVILLYQEPHLIIRNTSVNLHTVVVKAFRGWTPSFT
jgi:hypothetical protein